MGFCLSDLHLKVVRELVHGEILDQMNGKSWTRLGHCSCRAGLAIHYHRISSHPNRGRQNPGCGCPFAATAMR